MRELTDQEEVRRQKLEELRQKGVNPFGGKYDVTSDSKQIKDNFDKYSKEELAESKPEVL